jgi:hypothetical protein
MYMLERVLVPGRLHSAFSSAGLCVVQEPRYTTALKVGFAMVRTKISTFQTTILHQQILYRQRHTIIIPSHHHTIIT